MIHLRGNTAEGKAMYILGLRHDEMERIKSIPLVIHLTGIDNPEMELVVLSGETEQDIVDSLGAHNVEVRGDKTANDGEA